MAEIGFLRGNGVELIICKQSTISYPLHNHVSVFTLGFVLDGEIALTTEEGTSIYHENDEFVLLPYAPHCINARSCYTLLSLCISSGMIAELESEEARSAMASFLQDTIRQPGIEAKIMQALRGLPLISRPTPAQMEPAVSDLKTRLEMYPERKYSIDDMAKAAFISKYHLIRVFRRETGLTPHRFQLQNRIRKARKLLEKFDTITEVALATGFCDQSHFIRHFEKIVGLTPTDYKKACETGTPLFSAQVSAGINLANRKRPSGPAFTSCGNPMGRMEITPGS